MANKKTYCAKKKNACEKQTRNKKLALFLILSMAVLISLYFGMIKARVQIIQEIYIWASFVLALVYVFVSSYIAITKEKDQKGKKDSDRNIGIIPVLERVQRGVLLIFVPMIFALLIDYMMLILGFAKYFGI